MTIELDGESLTPEAVVRVAREDEPVRVPEQAREQVRTSRKRVESVLESEETVYGLNTGFGELVDERIPREDLEQLQANLLRSHAAGAGHELSREAVRAMMVTRVNALVKGYSGIREIVIDHLVTMLNEGVHPIVRSHGSLGASGDLAPLAHLSLVLIGEGEAIYDGTIDSGSGDSSTTSGEHDDSPGAPSDSNDQPQNSTEPRPGTRLSGAQALEAVGLEALSLEPKEGLALINGTQLTLGLAALVVVDATELVRAADIAGSLTIEVTLATTATADPAIHDVRPHSGQRRTAEHVRSLTAGSDVVEAHRNCDRVQDAYSLRCLPQVHGAVRDATAHLREAVQIELNSATDNPLIFPAAAVDDRASGTGQTRVLSGGNFHGEPLALRLEYLRLALTELGTIAERRIDRMVNPNLQEPHLPPFLAPESGLQSGYMIVQYTAAALLNELRSLGSAITDNTPVSGGQEDHVSMSAQSAFNARLATENVRTVIASELVCGAQGAEFVDEAFEGEETLQLGRGTASAYELLREIVPPLSSDRTVHVDVDQAEQLIADGLLIEYVVDHCNVNFELR